MGSGTDAVLGVEAVGEEMEIEEEDKPMSTAVDHNIQTAPDTTIHLETMGFPRKHPQRRTCLQHHIHTRNLIFTLIIP